MLNIIGVVPDAMTMLTIPGAHLHLYGKEPRPGRKLGHVTLRANDWDQITAGLDKLQRMID